MDYQQLKVFLNKKVDQYNQPFFIASDPISIPHLFTKQQDIEIAGFFAAVFSWGNRAAIIQKTGELMRLLEMQPHEFCLQHSEADLKKLLSFRHRTFNTTDLLYFVEFLKHHYSLRPSLESAFSMHGGNVRDMLAGFHQYFFSLDDAPARTRKHISTPVKKSTCKRLNMFLRWMVRDDGRGVDFGIWKSISPSQLICPVDLHVGRVARKLGLITRKQTDWQAATELTDSLRRFDPDDPVKYDFALFALGIVEKF